MKIKLTQEERELIEPAVRSRRLAEHGVREAVGYDKATHDSLFAMLKALFPNTRIITFDHPADGDWTVTVFEKDDPRLSDYDRQLELKRLMDPMKDLKPYKKDEPVEDDPELKLESTLEDPEKVLDDPES